MIDRRNTYAVAVSALVAGITWGAAALGAEERTFAVGYFGQAVANEDKDCGPDGPNPGQNAMDLKAIADLGYTGEQIEELLKQEKDGRSPLRDILRMRGRLNGEPVNPFLYPATVKDANWKALEGKRGYGFDLDGKGESSVSFVDPETLEKGVDNQLARAFGCYATFRGTAETRPPFWDWAWTMLKDSEPAWLITIRGDDLSKDGPVEVEFNRAYEHPVSNVDGTPRADVTYRMDPDRRSHNTLKGEMRDGQIYMTAAQDFRMQKNPLVVQNFELKGAKMRLRIKRDGTLSGYVGGYQRWADLYQMLGAPGSSLETEVVGDIPGLYWLLRKNADAAPDPKSGLNTLISATWYLEAVPAFVATAAAKQVATLETVGKGGTP